MWYCCCVVVFCRHHHHRRNDDDAATVVVVVVSSYPLTSATVRRGEGGDRRQQQQCSRQPCRHVDTTRSVFHRNPAAAAAGQGRCYGRRPFSSSILHVASSSTAAATTSDETSARNDGNNKSSSSYYYYSARYAAVQALTAAAKEGDSYAVQHLESDPRFRRRDSSGNDDGNTLSTRDKAFARLLVSTVDRRLGQIDRVIAYCSDKKTTGENSQQQQQQQQRQRQPQRTSSSPSSRRLSELLVRSVLRVGVAQLLFLGVPHHAAVMETVETMKKIATASASAAAAKNGGNSNSSNNNNKKKRNGKSKTNTVAAVKPVPQSKVNFVNAVLRRVARESSGSRGGDDGDDDKNNSDIDGFLRRASADDLTLNVSPWLVREWNEAWGHAATRRIVETAMSEAPRCLSVKAMMTTTTPTAEVTEATTTENTEEEDYREEQHTDAIRHVASLFENATILPQGSVRIDAPPPGPISSWPLYEDGAWWLQDPSATIPALALYLALCCRHQGDEHRRSARGVRVVDMCAAPGGKTAQLCSFGFTVTAIEKSKRRSRRLKENCDRLNMNWDAVLADATEWIPVDNGEHRRVAGVLLDVPCTASGTGSKRPDVLRRDEDIEELLDLQYRLACHAADNVVDVGGILVYATCSLTKTESEDQVTKLLNRRAGSEAQLETVPFECGEVPGFDGAIDSNGWMRILPGSPDLNESVRGSDGFFVARLKKTS